MKKFYLLVIIFFFTVNIYSIDLKRDNYQLMLYTNDYLNVKNYKNNPFFSSFYNKYGFLQIEISGQIYDKYYLLDGNIDYALMSFDLFNNGYLSAEYKTYEEYMKEAKRNLPERSISCAKNFKASSTLKDKKYIYEVKNIFVPCKGEYGLLWFQNLPWAEGKDDDGIGEFIEFEILDADHLLSDRVGDFVINGDITISILNGFVNPLKQNLFYENNRIKKAAIWIDGKRAFEINFNDYVEFTEFTVPEKTDKVRIEILDVYKGTKYNDTCVTKIDVNYQYIMDPNSELNNEL